MITDIKLLIESIDRLVNKIDYLVVAINNNTLSNIDEREDHGDNEQETYLNGSPIHNSNRGKNEMG